MITILGTANEFLSDGSVGNTRFYLITSWTIRLAEFKFKHKLNDMYKKYQYSITRFDLTKYIIHTDAKWLSDILNGLNHREIMELDYNIYHVIVETIKTNIRNENIHAITNKHK